MTEGLLFSDHSRIYLWTISFLPSFEWIRWRKSEIPVIPKSSSSGSTLQPVIRYYFITKIILFLWVLFVVSLILGLKRLCSFQSVQTVCPSILMPVATTPASNTNSFFPFHNRDTSTSQKLFPENPYHVVNSTSRSESSTKKLVRLFKSSIQRMVHVPRFIGESIKKTPVWVKSMLRKVIRRNQNTAGASMNYVTHKINDHMEADIETFNLSSEQIQRVYSTYRALTAALTPELLEKASASNVRLTPYLVYQYLASTDWLYDYNGISFVDALILTIQWRYEMYLNYYQTPDFTDLYHLIAGRMCYISHVPDQHQRAIIYFKLRNNHRRESVNLYRKLIVYTMDKAIEKSITHQSGRFVAVLDFGGFSFSTLPPFAFTQEVLGILKSHYPYRIDEIYLVNVGAAFSFLWSMVKPFIPKKAMDKMKVLSANDVKKADNVMVRRFGKSFLEEEYGGVIRNSYSDDDYNFNLTSRTIAREYVTES